MDPIALNKYSFILTLSPKFNVEYNTEASAFIKKIKTYQSYKALSWNCKRAVLFCQLIQSQ